MNKTYYQLNSLLLSLLFSILVVSPAIYRLWTFQPIEPADLLAEYYPSPKSRAVYLINPHVIPLIQPTIIPSPTPTQIVKPQLDTMEITKSDSSMIVNKKVAPAEIHALIEEFSNLYQVDSALVHHIARCESGYNVTSISSTGKYAGMFQFAEGTWISTRGAMGLDQNPQLRLDAREAIHTAVFKIANGGKQAWSGCLP